MANSDRRRRKRRPTRTAQERRMMQRVNVSHPTVSGAVEQVQRVIDPIESMWRRHQLADRRQPYTGRRRYTAAVLFRNAHERLNGSAGGAMDFERARGGGLPGQPPAMPYMTAAERANAVNKLYELDRQIIVMVVGEGHTLDDTAKAMGEKKEEIGARLRRSLDELADAYRLPREHDNSRDLRHGKFAQRFFDLEDVTTSDASAIIPSRVMQASWRGVKIIGGTQSS